jgi:hypothetical protein
LPKLALNAPQDSVSKNSNAAIKNHKSKKQKKSSSFMTSSSVCSRSSSPKLELNTPQVEATDAAMKNQKD